MSFVNKQLTLAAAVAAAIAAPTVVYATNGMNMEGYGPIATGMGGASMAYDNGTAAMMNNPATLGLAEDGTSRLDAALGILGPNITTSSTGMPDADSSATQFLMPALGWSKRAGKLTYGVGMFGQGGMGTEYKASSSVAAGSNQEVRSEVGVGRLLAPITYNVDDKLTIGGTVDFVWAGMDLKQALSDDQFTDMVSTQNSGTASGSLVNTFNGSGLGATLQYARFDFSDSSDFTGEAQGTGFAGKIGANYKINSRLSLGASYHSKTSLSDLQTSDAALTFNINPGSGQQDVVMTGEIEVKDFQWPDMFAFGAAYQVNDKLMLAADYKRINWAAVMKEFRMVFTADAVQASSVAQDFVDSGGTVMDSSMYQEWDDQNVIMLGGSYKVTDPLTLRAGLNLANNPVPDEFLNPLFPAIIKNHLTFGVGYAISQASSVDASLTYAPEVKQDIVDPATGAEIGMEVTHSQINWQFMYSYRF